MYRILIGYQIEKCRFSYVSHVQENRTDMKFFSKGDISIVLQKNVRDHADIL